MNRTQLLLTHGTVFSVGLATAMIANSLRAPSAAADGENAPRPSARHAAGSFGSAGSAGANGSRAAGDRSRASSRDSAPPAERLGEIVRINDSFARQRALMDLIDSLGPEQFAAVAGQFRELDHLGNARGEYGLILQGWAKLDPLAALAYTEANDGGRGRNTVLETWANNDASAAERWATENFTGEGPNPYLIPVIRGIAANDLSAATRLTESMPRSNERGQAIAALTDALFQQGIDAAKNFPAGITDDAMRGGLVGMIGDRLARKNPDDAAQWLASIQSGEDQQRAARGVADALAKEDPSKAATWLKSLQPEARAEAARGIIPQMANGDTSNITQTAQWVATLVGTPNYDSVVEEFVWSCNTRAPEQSAAWIQGVTDPDQQRRLYHRMLGEWAQHDAAAVKEWVSSNPAVPADVRRRFVR